MQTKKFQKRKEDFICEHCGKTVIGNGYTNHCPYCLWSKHVDINPGDRAETCQGLMKPIGIESKGAEFVVIQQCQKCGFQRKNKICAQDDFEQVLKITK